MRIAGGLFILNTVYAHYQKPPRLQERRNRCIDSLAPHMCRLHWRVLFPKGTMAVPGPPSLLISSGIAALIAWRMVARVRRMVGRQRLSAVRPWFTVCLVPVLLLGLLLVSLAHPWVAPALVAGVAIGVALGRYGLQLTTFEPTPQGLFYTLAPTWVWPCRCCSSSAWAGARCSFTPQRSRWAHRLRTLRAAR